MLSGVVGDRLVSLTSTLPSSMVPSTVDKDNAVEVGDLAVLVVSDTASEVRATRTVPEAVGDSDRQTRSDELPAQSAL